VKVEKSLRIAWICHFSNAEIQNIFHPGIKTNESAPWITQLAKLFENETCIELHIIAPDSHISGYKQFSLRNIHYHFFNPNISIFGYGLLDMFNLNIRTGYPFNKAFIGYIVNKKIKPDLIHLHGAENAYYSSSIFQFRKRYPVLITIQGFLSKSIVEIDYSLKKRIEVEKRILSSFKHFGFRTKTMGQDIRSFNPSAILHWHCYPFEEITPIETEKKYDIVFFARVCKDKGMDDLLKAVSIIKPKMPEVKLCVIGGGSSEYINMADQLGISDNVYWAGFLPTQKEVHKMAPFAKISVLPTYHDIISGTIIESLFLKLPVVAYSVGSIPEVNDKEEYITLVAKGDVSGLAEKILWLLSNPEVMKYKSEKAYIRAVEMFDNSNITEDLLNAYTNVIRDFKKK
jgi:glycosyltransferase involved in cell wall biosynthesis